MRRGDSAQCACGDYASCGARSHDCYILALIVHVSTIKLIHIIIALVCMCICTFIIIMSVN